MDNNPGESTTPEERLRLAEEKLAAAEEKYNNLVDNLDEAVFFLDTRGTITYMSPVIERISGYKVDDLVGKSFSAFVHPDDLPYLYDGLSNQLRGRPEPHEFRVVDTDGSVHFVRTAGRLFSKDGEPAGIAGSLVDITRQRRAEDALVESARQMRHFISVTAHELRHPIAIIKGYVQNLLELDKYHLDEEIVEILGAIEMSSDRLTRLVEELLDVSRIEQGHFAVVAREVEPHIYLHQAAEELRFRTPDCEFVFRLDETMGKVMADPDKFVRLMIILLENALRFAPSPCTVEVESGTDGDMAVFSVYDHGEGVPDEDRERIFERFYQVEEALHHSVPGVGLGLYIAREIVEGHGGSIWYEPREGGGSVFRFTIPLA